MKKINIWNVMVREDAENEYAICQCSSQQIAERTISMLASDEYGYRELYIKSGIILIDGVILNGKTMNLEIDTIEDSKPLNEDDFLEMKKEFSDAECLYSEINETVEVPDESTIDTVMVKDIDEEEYFKEESVINNPMFDIDGNEAEIVKDALAEIDKEVEKVAAIVENVEEEEKEDKNSTIDIEYEEGDSTISFKEFEDSIVSKEEIKEYRDKIK